MEKELIKRAYEALRDFNAQHLPKLSECKCRVEKLGGINIATANDGTLVLNGDDNDIQSVTIEVDLSEYEGVVHTVTFANGKIIQVYSMHIDDYGEEYTEYFENTSDFIKNRIMAKFLDQAKYAAIAAYYAKDQVRYESCVKSARFVTFLYREHRSNYRVKVRVDLRDERRVDVEVERAMIAARRNNLTQQIRVVCSSEMGGKALNIKPYKYLYS